MTTAVRWWDRAAGASRIAEDKRLPSFGVANARVERLYSTPCERVGWMSGPGLGGGARGPCAPVLRRVGGT